MLNCGLLVLIEDSNGMGIIELKSTTFDGAEYCLLLSDHNRWGPVQAEFDEWCKQYGAVRKGMLVYYDDPTFVVMMKLRWI